MAQGPLGAAGVRRVRRVGYGLEVGRSVSTAGGRGGGAGHSWFTVADIITRNVKR